MKHLITLLGITWLSLSLNAQLVGKVTDENGDPLPYASIFEVNGKAGATTNEAGQYSVALTEGAHQIVFQYIGYQRVEKTVQYKSKPIVLNLQLQPNAVNIKEVVISADAEDPAYAIMRKAIAKRAYFRSKMTDYNCRVYVKGLHKLADAPDKIFGKSLGDMSGILDSNRQGVIYLSESFSRLYFAEGGKNIKEVMEQSKVSGADAAMNFNRASYTLLTMYNETTDLGRPILSPLADNAFQYYRFKLEGTWYTDKQESVARIRLIPKRKNDPVYSGVIEILEDASSLYSVDVMLSGDNILQPLLDTLTIKQTLAPVRPETWATRTQVFGFGFKIIGFKYKGVFTSVFSDYLLDDKSAAPLAKAETFRVNSDIIQSDTFWVTERPIPLTAEEYRDYTRKDSIARITSSKVYLDSTDRRSNRFGIGDLLFGYTWRNSWKHRSFEYHAPINSVQYNTVQGLNFDIALTWRQSKNKTENQYWSLSPNVQYGLADKQLRPSLAFSRKWNPKHHQTLKIEAGRELLDYNQTSPVPSIGNTLTTLFNRFNPKKFFEKDYLSVQYGQRISPLLFVDWQTEIAERRAVQNQTNYSFKKDRSKAFSSNNPRNQLDDQLAFQPHQAITNRLKARLYLGATYTTNGNARSYETSDLPIISALYKNFYLSKSYDGANNDVFMHQFSLGAEQENIEAGIAGALSWYIEGGTMLNSRFAYLQDYQFVQANPFILSLAENQVKQFQLLELYGHGTRSAYVQTQVAHQFNGYFFDKIPLVRRLKFTEQLIVRHLQYFGNSADVINRATTGHLECAFAIQNIGFKAARLFRLEYVTAPPVYRGQVFRHRFVIGMSSTLGVSFN